MTGTNVVVLLVKTCVCMPGGEFRRNIVVFVIVIVVKVGTSTVRRTMIAPKSPIIAGAPAANEVSPSAAEVSGSNFGASGPGASTFGPSAFGASDFGCDGRREPSWAPGPEP